MKDLKLFKRLFLVALLGLPLALGGCSGDDGDTGPQGPPGPGTLTAESCSTCHKTGAIADVTPVHPGLVTPKALTATIDSFTVTGGFATTVFTVKDPATGMGVPGLGTPSSNTPSNLQYIRIAYAQLEPDSTTTNTNAQTKTIGTRWVPLTRDDRLVADLTDNGGGQYTYVSTTDISATYDPTLLTRVLLILNANANLKTESLNVIQDVPGTGAVLSREIVTTDACDACHDRLGSPLSGNLYGNASFHGGSRYLTKGCVVCHTSFPESTNPDAGIGVAMTNGTSEAEFGPMIHKIHSAKVTVGLGDFSDVTYPQDIRNCTTCHKGGTQSNNYKDFQNNQNCFESCHTTSVVTAFNHANSVVPDNSPCANCHGPSAAPNQIGPALEIPSFHAILAQAESLKFKFNIVKNAFDATTRVLSVTYSVTDPTTNPATPYVLNGANADFAWTQGSNSRLFVDIGFPPKEITNDGNGMEVGQPISLNALAGTDNSDGTYTVSTMMPAGVTQATVAMEGHPAAADTATNSIIRVPVDCPVVEINLDATGTVVANADKRPVTVDIAKCDKCHFQLSLHGNNRTNNIGLCVLCHNANATDVEQRLTATPPVNAANPGPDGLTEQAIDFKVMIHGIHQASGITVYGFSSTPNIFDAVTFPGILSNCEMCHVAGTFGVGAPLSGTLDTTTGTGANLVSTNDNLRTTKTMSVCSSCHIDSGAINHMLIEGGKQNLTEDQIQALP